MAFLPCKVLVDLTLLLGILEVKKIKRKWQISEKSADAGMKGKDVSETKADFGFDISWQLSYENSFSFGDLNRIKWNMNKTSSDEHAFGISCQKCPQQIFVWDIQI